MYSRHTAFIALIALLSSLAVAQSGKAELYGHITDASGLPAANVVLSVRGEAKGWSVETRSTAGGDFHFLGLPAGIYRVRAESAGFRSYERTGLRLQTNDRVPLEIRLEVGEVADAVEVRADAPILATDRGSVTKSLDETAIANIPLDGRNFIPLLATLPGVALPRGSDFPRLNGSRPRTNEYIYDGISILQPEPGQVAYYPIIDAMAELRVDLNSYSAEYGRSNGGVVQVHHKSGSNDFHGSLFEFFRHEKLNARNLFAPEGPRPRFRRNQFGGVLGGPIRRNETFFFAEYQGTRLGTGRSLISTVPSSLQRAGIFTEAQNGVVPRIYDPESTRTVDGVVSRTPFPNATIPLNRLDPVAQRVVERYPTPNSGTGHANNFLRTGTEAQDQDQFGLRLDHHFGTGHRAFVRYVRLLDNTNPVSPLPEGSGRIASGAIAASRTRSNALVTEHSWAISATALNQARFGFTARSFASEALRLGRSPLDVLGLPNIPASGFGDVLPAFESTGYQQIGPTADANRDFSTSVTQLVDTLSLIRGTHSVKLGTDLRFQRLNMLQPSDPTGRFRFTTPFTGLPSVPQSGSSLASLLLGQVESYSVDIQEEKLRPRAQNAEFFIQDDWKATRTLSLNLGLRYTLNLPSTESEDRAAVFDLDTEQLRFLGRDGNPRAARELKFGNVGPRIGIAWRAMPHLVIRSGYGVAWFEMAGITTPFTTPFFPYVQSVGESSLDNISPAFRLHNGPSVQALAVSPDAGLGQGVFGVDRKNGSGYSQQWNFTVQSALRSNLSLEVGYLGSKVTRLGVPDGNLNQLTAEQLALGSALLASVPNPYLGQVPQESSLGRASISQAQLLKPWPRFTTVSLYRNNIGHSVYHGLQSSFEKRMANGLSFRVAYTFSKLIDDASSVFSASAPTGPVANFPIADSLNRRNERDLSRGDIPHVFAASFVWEVPGPAGAGILRHLARGWRMAGVGRVQSGLPIPIAQQTNFNSFAGYGSQRPNRVADPMLPESQRSTARYFDTDAFALAPRFTLGNSSRNPIRGPGWRTLDLMVGKTIPVNERLRFEFRAEAFNLTNTPPLGEPNVAFGSPAFGTITSAGDPRVFEFVLKALF